MVKYIYSDSPMTAVKSEQADLVVSAVERFAQIIPLNIQEIFLWYFEQKGVDNPERFLGVNEQSVPSPQPSPVWRGSVGQAMPDNNPENQLSQTSQGFDINTLTFLLGLMQQVKKEKGNNAAPEDFIKVLENAIAQEQENNNEV